MIRNRRTIYRSLISPPLFGLLLSASSVSGQVDTLGETWRWVRFTSESGLPSDQVRTVTETPAGTVWAMTHSGIAWFDGYQWRSVGPERGLPLEQVQLLRPYSRDDVLVSISGRLFMGNRDGFREVPVERAGVQLGVEQVIEFVDGSVMIHSGGTLYQYKDNRWEDFSAATQLPLGSVDTLWDTEDGVWFSTANELYQWDGKGWTMRMSIPGHAQIEFRQPLVRPGGKAFVHITSPVEISGFWELEKGFPPKCLAEEGWDALLATAVGPQGDILAIDISGRAKARTDGTWIEVELGPFDPSNVTFMRFDSRGDLWVATGWGLFLHRRTSRLWTRWRFPPGDLRNRINEILRAGDGSVWLGTGNGVVIWHHDGDYESITEVDGTELGAVTGLVEDSGGAIWVASGMISGGAYKWDGGRWRHYGPEEGLTAPRIHKIRSDRQGRLWFLGLGEVYPGPGNPQLSEPGAFEFSNGRFTRWDTGTGLLNARVYAFSEDEEGALWFGTYGGLSRWKEGEWTHWTVENGLRFNKVFALDVDGRNRVWFTDQVNGIGYMEDGRPNYLTSADGLVSNLVWDIRIDDRGRIWISTIMGLSCFDHGNWITVTTATGLSSSRIWPVLPHRDTVYIGTLGNGLDMLDLTAPAERNPRIVIAEPVIQSRDALLRWQAFSYMGELTPSQIESRYRLGDDPWSEWGQIREVYLRILPPGDYRFSVQARGLLGNFSEAGASVGFTVAVPFYYSLPFLLPLGLFFFISLFLVFNLQQRRRRYLQELFKSEKQYRTLFDSAPFGIAIHDNDQILFTNPAGSNLLGFDSPEEAFGSLLADHMSMDDWESVRDYLSRGSVSLEQIPLREIMVFRKDGSEAETEWEVIPYTYMGQPAFLSVFIDVTDRKHLEAQLLQSQKMEAVGALAGGIAHDFNNLLTAISGYSEVLLEGMREGDSRRVLIEEIQKAADRATSLTDQLLVFSRQEVAETRVLDIASVITGMAEMLRRLIGEQINLIIDLGPDLGMVSVAQGQIEQLIMNLAINARDAMPGGGTLSIEASNTGVDDDSGTGTVQVAPGEYLAIVIRDTGVGMDDQTLKRIFEPFFTTKEPGKGTGLGLSTVHGIVQRCSGDIRVESTPGVGTTFKIYLPRVDEEKPLASGEETGVVIGLGSETVLLVEDEEVVRNYIRRVLDSRGYKVIVAEDGVEALQLGSGSAEPIHILVTDVIMPKMDGKELAGHLLKQRPDMKVLYLSGYTDDVIGRADLLKPGQAFLKKPVKPDALIRKVQELLHRVG